MQQKTVYVFHNVHSNNRLCVCTQVLGAHLNALSHYYAALVHMTIVRELMKTEKEEACKLNLINFCSVL